MKFVLNALLGVRLHFSSQRGQDLIEYALLGGLIAGALLAAGIFLGMENGIAGMANGIGECIDFDGVDCV